MQMLPAGQENKDTEVSWVDQQKINAFSKLNTRMSNLEDEYEAQKQEKEYLDDVTMEMELIDEERVQYKIGDAFLYLPQPEVLERLEQDIVNIDTAIEETESKILLVNNEMDDLKKYLYAKFGDSINLER
ncbi:Prefoldin, subunit 4 [Nadsonia fulvescens var. elongata DSM 6958]|uniref:Prefoldin subunit 4 n=1 Tax=Nadsonia fulvescens var. elongata DSM 6958 TaxID=857566 RepID=A0A1E3PRY0_9ASCO|nr:Prefoldin, subunit 4 [Nadsonia fulvescens var. elongata DSM 6958]